MYACQTGLAELTEVANVQRVLPSDYLHTGKTMVTSTFYTYALPLIGEPLPIYPELEHARISL